LGKTDQTTYPKKKEKKTTCSRKQKKKGMNVHEGTENICKPKTATTHTIS
jgi:hypothetical protein